MESQSQLITETERYTTKLILTRGSTNRWFHGLEHTQSVARSCFRLAQMASLPYADLEMVLVAAWFHDTGYIVRGRDHERESIKIAVAFLKPFNRSDEFTQGVQNLIMATRVPPAPSGLLEEIICDADMAHLGSVAYQRCETLLRRELELTEKTVMSDKDWLRNNIAFFRQHKYFTRYARELWEEGKNLNLKRLCDIAPKE